MSVNTAHANGCILIHSGEYILSHSKNASIEFFGQKSPLFQRTKLGCIFLTSHRIIFKNTRQTDYLLSFSAPFIALSELELHQPFYDETFITGKVRSQPNGNYTGCVQFKLSLNYGEGSQFFEALQCVSSLVLSTFNRCPEIMPPYTPARAWYEASQAAYQPPLDFKDLFPTFDLFNNPKPVSVYMTDNPAPFPGIETPLLQHRRRSYEAVAAQVPTPVHSFDGFGQPPKYGIVVSVQHDGVFPHQAAQVIK